MTDEQNTEDTGQHRFVRKMQRARINLCQMRILRLLFEM